MKIWSCWLQGRTQAPQTVQQILRLWECQNPEADLTVLEEPEVNEILKATGVQTHGMTPQVKTNIARTYLLAKHGGFWVDSTLLPTKPLNQWFDSNYSKTGFFAFHSSGCPELVLQNWFLYAEKDNYLVTKWLDLYTRYFSVMRFHQDSRRIFTSPYIWDKVRFQRAIKRGDLTYFVDPIRGWSCRVYPYALHNYCLAFLLDQDPDAKTIWDSTLKQYNVIPSLIGNCSRDNDTPEETFVDISCQILPTSPVHKLNHRDKRFSRIIDVATEKCLLPNL